MRENAKKIEDVEAAFKRFKKDILISLWASRAVALITIIILLFVMFKTW